MWREWEIGMSGKIEYAIAKDVDEEDDIRHINQNTSPSNILMAFSNSPVGTFVVRKKIGNVRLYGNRTGGHAKR